MRTRASAESARPAKICAAWGSVVASSAKSAFRCLRHGREIARCQPCHDVGLPNRFVVRRIWFSRNGPCILTTLPAREPSALRNSPTLVRYTGKPWRGMSEAKPILAGARLCRRTAGRRTVCREPTVASSPVWFPSGFSRRGLHASGA
jgi:predicted RNA-binding Zn-ribbon protein involved in translation (DUF1610 family)